MVGYIRQAVVYLHHRMVFLESKIKNMQATILVFFSFSSSFFFASEFKILYFSWTLQNPKQDDLVIPYTHEPPTKNEEATDKIADTHSIATKQARKRRKVKLRLRKTTSSLLLLLSYNVWFNCCTKLWYNTPKNSFECIYSPDVYRNMRCCRN